MSKITKEDGLMKARQLEKGNKTLQLMGTTIHLTVVHEEPYKIIDEITARLINYEQRFSANDPSSELSEINKHAGIQAVKVHPELYELIQIGKLHSIASNSNLNIAIHPLTQLWRIGFDDARVPTDEEIKQRLQRINPYNILLNDEESSVFLSKKGMSIDLGALAKGYIADRVISYLKEMNVASSLINLGGNLVTYGPALKRPDKEWRIGIQNPVHARGNSQVILSVKNKSVVTSGIYERNLQVNGQMFHHIFDSQTGYPVETDIASLTIVSDLSVDGEIWTSRLFGQPAVQIITTLNQMETIDGLLILTSGKVLFSEGLKDLMV